MLSLSGVLTCLSGGCGSVAQEVAELPDSSADQGPSNSAATSTTDTLPGTPTPSGEPSNKSATAGLGTGSTGGSADIELIQIPADTWTFDARRAGPADGELVLMLHGFPETSLEWSVQLRELGKAGYHVVAPDQRGYSAGARPTGVEEYSTAKLVGDVLDIANRLNAQRFHLVGHDWGAAVAWAFAAKHPERLLSLNPISVPHPDAFSAELRDKNSCQYEASAYFDLFIQPNFEDSLLAFNATGLRNTYEGLPPERVEAYVQALGNKPALGSGLNWYRANIKDRQTVDPPTGPIAVPTLFIWSDQDKAICEEGALATKKFVSGEYRFHALEGINHWVPEMAGEEVAQLLLDHLRANPDD